MLPQVLVIAHRLSTVRDANQVLVISGVSRLGYMMSAYPCLSALCLLDHGRLSALWLLVHGRLSALRLLASHRLQCPTMQGTIAEQGTHDELLAMQGIYQKLVQRQLQFKTPEDEEGEGAQGATQA